MAKNKVTKIIDGCFWMLNLTMGGLFIFVVVAGYLALRPDYPKIDSPEALLEQSRELVGESLAGHSDFVEAPREQWPPAIAALRPPFVHLFSRSGETRGSVVDYVDIIISTGGIGGNYGYLVCIPRKGDAGSFLIHKNSAVIFENESGSVIRYIADH